MMKTPQFTAFPVPGMAHNNMGFSGISARQYFAAKAMQSLIIGWEKVNGHYLAVTDMAEIAKESFQMADAMLDHVDVNKDVDF